MARYNLTVQDFHKGFRQHFPDLGNPNKFLDVVLSATTMQPHLDVIALDSALHTPDGMSTAEYVTTRYGEAATAWVRSLL